MEMDEIEDMDENQHNKEREQYHDSKRRRVFKNLPRGDEQAKTSDYAFIRDIPNDYVTLMPEGDPVEGVCMKLYARELCFFDPSHPYLFDAQMDAAEYLRVAINALEDVKVSKKNWRDSDLGDIKFVLGDDGIEDHARRGLDADLLANHVGGRTDG